MAHISRITVYPVKSFDPALRTEAVVLPSGALQHDRQFALVGPDLKFINAKRTPLVHRLQFTIDPERREFRVFRRDGGGELRGQLDRNGPELAGWLSDYFSVDVTITEDLDVGFPDDVDSPGPTIVSRATLETVAGWFPGMTLDEVRLRFRANLEIEGVEPFWEDRLFRADRNPVPFRIGSSRFGGVNPCQRCVVPTRNPLTGEVAPNGFAKNFGELRQRTLPPWAAGELFDHFYRLTTNTVGLNAGLGVIRVSDPIEL